MAIKTLRVLVVENEDIVRQDFAGQLRDHGHDVTEAENGLKALDVLRAKDRQTFDVVLLDLEMPCMNGVDFLRRAYDEGHLKCPVVVVTAYRDALKEQLPGILAVLNKPMDTNQLAERVEELIAS